MLNDMFHKILGNTPILGMLHLAGDDPFERALEEIAIFEEEGVDGAIVENYHGDDVEEVLGRLRERKTKVVLGVNILPNEFGLAFDFASRYGAQFIQLDHVAGRYIGRGTIDFESYSRAKAKHPRVVVLGGVWPKYYEPICGPDPESDMRRDVIEGTKRAEAIVVTGSGTGSETPREKVNFFRRVLDSHPLIIGAGLTPQNAYEQLKIADGAIVGSTFKPSTARYPSGDTHLCVDRAKVREFMDVVRKVRMYKERPDN